jgi:hypothetical protein
MSSKDGLEGKLKKLRLGGVDDEANDTFVIGIDFGTT